MSNKWFVTSAVTIKFYQLYIYHLLIILCVLANTEMQKITDNSTRMKICVAGFIINEYVK